MLCVKFAWNWPSGSGEEDFFNLPMYFHNFWIISPWKRAGPIIWTNLNPLHLRMLCAKFGWNWPSGSGEDFKICQWISQFRNYLPLEKGGAHHLNKFEFSSPKDALCQVWLKLGQWFWRRRWKCEKFTMTTTMMTDLIRKAHLSSRFRWAKRIPAGLIKI